MIESEEISPDEHKHLSALMADIEPADIDDMDLHDFGGHRALYEFLTKRMGLSVKRGRGPAWQRARGLIDRYEVTERLE